MSEITVTCPQRRRITGRRQRHTIWWTDPRWIEFRDEHARVPGAVCNHCHYKHGEQRRDRHGNLRYYKTGKHQGQPIIVSLTVNHLDRESYNTLEDYLTWDPKKTEVCCTRCNKEWEHGKVICPGCNVNYIHWSADPFLCRECREEKNPELKAQREEKQGRQRDIDRKRNNARALKKKRQKTPHSCHYRGLTGQKCKRTPGAICEHNTRNAPVKCNHWKKRVEKK